MALWCTVYHMARGRAGRSGFAPPRIGYGDAASIAASHRRRRALFSHVFTHVFSPVEKDIAVSDDDDLGPIVSIDLRAVRIRIEEIDGDAVLLVDDGEIEVEFGSGLGGTFEQAILGAERLASTALAYAEVLRRRRPNRKPKQLAAWPN